MKKKNYLTIGILVLIIIGTFYLVQISECSEKQNSVNYIDFGGYNVYTCWESCWWGCPMSEQVIHLFAEEYGIRRKLTTIKDFSSVVRGIGGENGAIEFINYLPYLSDFNCFELKKEDFDNYTIDFNITVPFKEREIKKEGNDFIIERDLGCTDDVSHLLITRIIRSSERLSENGNYNFTIKELIFERTLS